jgi:GcrA cell cycle regulator
MTFWTNEKVETLIKLWGTMPASKIGKLLDCTRNAVLGKAHRVGLRKLQAAVIQKGHKREPVNMQRPLA